MKREKHARNPRISSPVDSMQRQSPWQHKQPCCKLIFARRPLSPPAHRQGIEADVGSEPDYPLVFVLCDRLSGRPFPLVLYLKSKLQRGKVHAERFCGASQVHLCTSACLCVCVFVIVCLSAACVTDTDSRKPTAAS